MKQEEPILVAIHCLVYNHEPYLRDCFEGFVMQKTNFRFVAVVHEDASTDNSAVIIREYEAKYPDIFRPIYETENQWHKTDGSLGRIMNAAINATGAKYVAMCEGDDYWTDPYKLQKQVDFLEEHEEFSLCCHGYSILNVDKGTMVEKRVVLPPESKDGLMFTNAENMMEWYTKTPTVLMRADVYKAVPDLSIFKYACDTYIFYYILKQGKGYYLSFNGAVYRAHGGGVYSSLSSFKKDLNCVKIFYEIYTHNREDDVLEQQLLDTIKWVSDEIIWNLKDKEWTLDVFEGISLINTILYKEKKYKDLFAWHKKLAISQFKRVKRKFKKYIV